MKIFLAYLLLLAAPFAVPIAIAIVGQLLAVRSTFVPGVALRAGSAFDFARREVAHLASRSRFALANETGGACLELLTGFVTAPDTTQTALTMATGNSLTVRAAGPNSLAKLLTLWVDVQLRGIFRLRSPKLHDNNQGLRFGT